MSDSNLYLDRLAMNIRETADRVCDAQETLREIEQAGEYDEIARDEMRNAIRDLIRDAELLKNEYML